MPLLEDLELYFSTNDLYQVLGVDKSASEAQIKKGYKKASLKIHPDRVGESEKEEATKRFQVLAKVHYILSDSESRKLYDEQGIIASDDHLESEVKWDDYWRALFPRVSSKDIDDFMTEYVGSEQEEKDLIAHYERHKGDLNVICEYHFGYDEDRTTQQLNRLIEQGKIKKYAAFAKESATSKAKRANRFQKEAKNAAKVAEKTGQSDNFADLQKMIAERSKGNFDNMIASLEAKYGSSKSKGTKRKRKES